MSVTVITVRAMTNDSGMYFIAVTHRTNVPALPSRSIPAVTYINWTINEPEHSNNKKTSGTKSNYILK